MVGSEHFNVGLANVLAIAAGREAAAGDLSG